MANVSITALKEALAQVDFPADKDQILRTAEQQGVRGDAHKALRSLPPVEYTNVDEVVGSVMPDVGSEPVESITADPENKPDSPGVAERLR